MNLIKVSIASSDLESSQEFLQSHLFGFEKYGQNQYALSGSSFEFVCDQNCFETLPVVDHLGILLPDRVSLAALLLHLAESNAAIVGATDHGVIESIYVKDPSGLTLEFYAEKPAGEWAYDEEGALIIQTADLNIDALLLTLKGNYKLWKKLPAGTKLGHIHVNMPDIEPIAEILSRIPNGKLDATNDGSSLYFANDTGLYQIRVTESEVPIEKRLPRLKSLIFTYNEEERSTLQEIFPFSENLTHQSVLLQTSFGLNIEFQPNQGESISS